MLHEADVPRIHGDLILDEADRAPEPKPFPRWIVTLGVALAAALLWSPLWWKWVVG